MDDMNLFSLLKKMFVVFGLLTVTGVLSACSNESDSVPQKTTGSLKEAVSHTNDGEIISLNDEQLKFIETTSSTERQYFAQITAVGSIDFNENRSVLVFSSYPGKIIQAFLDIGDEVKKGQILYTIDSPDLVAAESTLISAAGVYELTTAALSRDSKVFAANGMAKKDLDQAVSDQQAAEGAFNAARDAVRIFGKTDDEINKIIKTKKVDSVLVVRSPISGKVTARAAQPGLLVQPGNLPAPFAVADLSTMWMNANVPEGDSPLLQIGQSVQVKIMAFPDRDFPGKITKIGLTVDPNTHTDLVRCDIGDPEHELRPGMLATFVINVNKPIKSVSVPVDSIVREGDGTLTLWVVKDAHHFVKRKVIIGLQQDGFDQIVTGLDAGIMVVAKNAVFLSNVNNSMN